MSDLVRGSQGRALAAFLLPLFPTVYIFADLAGSGQAGAEWVPALCQALCNRSTSRNVYSYRLGLKTSTGNACVVSRDNGRGPYSGTLLLSPQLPSTQLCRLPLRCHSLSHSSLHTGPLPTCSLICEGRFVGLISAPRVLSWQTITEERKPDQVKCGGHVPQPGTEGKNSQAGTQVRTNVTPVVQERGLSHRPKPEHRQDN